MNKTKNSEKSGLLPIHGAIFLEKSRNFFPEFFVLRAAAQQGFSALSEIYVKLKEYCAAHGLV
jgi:hypothetical protein